MMREPQNTTANWNDSFIVRAMDDELLVYDLRTQRVSALNDFTARVWRAWDGGRDANQVAEALAAEGMPANNLQAVWNALDMLAKSQLIDASQMEEARPRARRDFLRRWATATAIATVAPSVLTIVAPMPAEAASVQCNPACTGSTPVCDTATKKCVQCIVNTDCKNPALPICSTFICGTGGIL